MQQRRLRLGDILDDYCPRERRITNHAVVAMIDDKVKQVRCTTCDADHDYKQAKVPALRRKKTGAALVADADGALRPRPAASDPDLDDQPLDEQEEDQDVLEAGESVESVENPILAEDAALEAEADADADAEGDGPGPAEDDGPVHRRLIRATLPRPEGQAPERKAPDFTIRQPGGRGGREFDGNNNAHRPGGRGRPMRAQGGPPGQPSRFGGPRQGSGQGQRPPGNRPGHPGANRGGGRPPGQGRGPGGGGRKRGR